MADACRLVSFGAFELDLDGGVLPRYGRRVPLQEQPARILSLLVSRPGEVVTREELRHLVWTNETFVEFDASLNAAITKIRRALSDSASAPRFIETVPKRGYRFLADVQGLPAWVGVNGRRHARQSSLLLQRRRISKLDRRRRMCAEHARPRYRAIVAVTLLSAWLLSPGLARQLARRSCGR